MQYDNFKDTLFQASNGQTNILSEYVLPCETATFSAL